MEKMELNWTCIQSGEELGLHGDDGVAASQKKKRKCDDRRLHEEEQWKRKADRTGRSAGKKKTEFDK